MPIILEISLKALENAAFHGGTGRSTQGLWLNLWRGINPDIGAFLKTRSDIRPYAISPLMNADGDRELSTVRENQTAKIFLSIFDGQRFLKKHQPAQEETVPAPPSVEALTEFSWLPALLQEYRTNSLELSGSRFQLISASITHRKSFQEIDDLSRSLNFKKKPCWQLRFLTPTSFKVYDNVILPLPFPRYLFAGWRRQWNNWSPRTLRLNGWVDDLMYLIKITRLENIFTSVEEYGKQKEVGFTGCVCLQSADVFPENYLHELNTLVSFSEFCGTGIHTARGMGITRLEM